MDHSVGWISTGNGRATGGDVLTLDPDGSLLTTRPGRHGVTALRQLDAGFVIGSSDGTVAILGGQVTTTEPAISAHPGAPSSPVTVLAVGNDGATVAAGFGSGAVRLLDVATAEPLLEFALSSSVDHLLLRGNHLYAVSRAGEWRVMDVHVFHETFCELLREVRERVPVVWKGKRLVPGQPAEGDPCQQTASSVAPDADDAEAAMTGSRSTENPSTHPVSGYEGFVSHPDGSIEHRGKISGPRRPDICQLFSFKEISQCMGWIQEGLRLSSYGTLAEPDEP